MYGAVPPKSKITARKADDNTVEMQPLMVDPYFDKNFAPEVIIPFVESFGTHRLVVDLIFFFCCYLPCSQVLFRSSR